MRDIYKLLKKNKVLFFFIILLLFIKVDYRILNQINCCVDDFDYYSHAYTVIIDKDFDYSNQYPQASTEVFKINNKVIPLGFVGSGILSAPFLLIGKIIDNFYPNTTTTNTWLFYSLSSIFYLFISIRLIYNALDKSGKNPNIFFIALLLFGSGLSYFSFERFSMTHVYEVFTISLILNLIVKIQTKNKNIYLFLLPVIIFLALLVRYTNYYVILLPYIFNKILFNKNKLFEIKNLKFILSGFSIGILIFYLVTKNVYGLFTLNPTKLYGDSSKIDSYLNATSSLTEFVVFNLKSFFVLFFSQEFGLFWFNPIVFIGCILIFTKIKKSNFLLLVCLLACYFQNFLLVSIWQSTASSYGFRYVLSLVPLSIVLVYTNSLKKLKNYTNLYLTIFSLFGLLSIFLFESSPTIQLYEYQVTNSFGALDLYSNPNYLSGYLEAAFNINSYFNAIGNSLLVALILRIFISLNLIDLLVNFSNISLPDNLDDYIQILTGLKFLNLCIFLIILYFTSIKLIKNYIENN